MTGVKWKFKGMDIYFISDKDKLTRDVMRHRNRLKTKAKIEIINDLFTNSESADADSLSSNGSASVENVEVLRDLSDSGKPEGEETVRLRSVFDDVDSTTAPPIFMEGKLSNGNVSSSGDSLAGK